MSAEKINYQLITDRILSELSSKKERPLLLLHACCGPCSSYVVTYLSEYFDIDILYYNPNTFPESEYFKRYKQLEKLCNTADFKGNVRLIENGYGPECFYEAIKGHESEPEGKGRCEICYRLRLTEAANEAKKRNADWFSTTLSVSPHKSSALLNNIGRELEEEYGIKYLYSDFKKLNGYKQSIELSKKYGLYRQDYCGCEFSLSARETSLPISSE